MPQVRKVRYASGQLAAWGQVHADCRVHAEVLNSSQLIVDANGHGRVLSLLHQDLHRLA